MRKSEISLIFPPSERIRCVHVLANPFPRPANLTPHFCFHYVVSPYLSRSITSRWLSSFQPRVPQGTLVILRSSRDHAAFPVPFQFHETKGLARRTEEAFPESHQKLVSNYFSKGGERRHIRGFWTEGKETRVSSFLHDLHSPVFSS